ncbi:MAG: RluA family pseudouridine synthase [Lentimicrobiaceae bacterium]|nr:RluA family pseudouridine synthase [Lentimicrobiaceae bacterium]
MEKVKYSTILLEYLQKEKGIQSKTKIRSLLGYGAIKVNGVPANRIDSVLNAGDELEIVKPPQKFKATQKPLFPVLFEDEWYIAVDKPAGLLSAGEVSAKTDTALKAVTAYIKESSRGKQRAHIVHRLDKEVSGILVIAKTEEAMQRLKDNWQDTEKLYYALVEGHPALDEGIIRSWLKEYKEKIFSVKESADAKLAITHYRVIKKYPLHTLLEVKLETGRKNQIRVHLSDLKCPIVGDYKYGADKEFVRRIRLHAFSFGFFHPYTKKQVIITSPMPKKFISLKPADEKYK